MLSPMWPPPCLRPPSRNACTSSSPSPGRLPSSTHPRARGTCLQSVPPKRLLPPDNTPPHQTGPPPLRPPPRKPPRESIETARRQKLTGRANDHIVARGPKISTQWSECTVPFKRPGEGGGRAELGPPRGKSLARGPSPSPQGLVQRPWGSENWDTGRKERGRGGLGRAAAAPCSANQIGIQGSGVG